MTDTEGCDSGNGNEPLNLLKVHLTFSEMVSLKLLAGKDVVGALYLKE